MADWRTSLAAQRAHDQRQARPLLDLLKPGEPIGYTQVLLHSLLRVADHPEVVPRIVELIEVDERVPIRTTAARTLGRLKDPRAVPVLEHVALDAGVGARVTYFEALGGIGGPAAAHALGRLFDSYRDLGIRLRILKQLARTADPEVIAIIQQRRASANSIIRADFAKTLGQIGGDAAVNALVEMADDPHPRVRKLAVKALARSGTPAAIEKLKALRTKTWSPYARWSLDRQINAATQRPAASA